MFWNILGNGTLVVSTLVLGLVASVIGWLPPRGRGMYGCARLWSRMLMASSGTRLRASFETPLDPQRGYIFMANHQSMYDIPALIATLPGQVRFMAKKSLFKVPIFGWALYAGGFVPVDRGNREAAARTYQAAIECLERGNSLLIFPEQTRSITDELLPFKKGGVVIAQKTRHPVVPVGIIGTRDVRPKGSVWIRPASVEVRFGSPIEVAERGNAEREELLLLVRDHVERLRRRSPVAAKAP